jgi:CheY-like chemotaxis protein
LEGVVPLEAPQSRPLALIVDDHADTREMYALHLRHEGMRVLEATDGDQAPIG